MDSTQNVGPVRQQCGEGRGVALRSLGWGGGSLLPLHSSHSRWIGLLAAAPVRRAETGGAHWESHLCSRGVRSLPSESSGLLFSHCLLCGRYTRTLGPLISNPHRSRQEKLVSLLH